MEGMDVWKDFIIMIIVNIKSNLVNLVSLCVMTKKVYFLLFGLVICVFDKYKPQIFGIW